MRLLIASLGAWLGLLWVIGAAVVLAFTVYDLVRCRQLPTPVDVALVLLGPVSLALAARLALKDTPHDR